MSNLVLLKSVNNNFYDDKLDDLEEFEKCEKTIDYIINFLYEQPSIPNIIIDLLSETIERHTVLASKILYESEVISPKFD